MKLTLPTGQVCRHASSKRFQLVAEFAGHVSRVTGRDDLLPGVNTFHAFRLRHPNHRVWLVDSVSGAVVREGGTT